MNHYDISVNSGGVRREELEGREHLVVPVKAVEEGVLDGGFLAANVIADSEPGWNGVPVVAGHPTNGSPDAFISANQPEVQENLTFGRFFDADAADGEMTGELWLDTAKAERLSDGQGFDVAVNAIEKLENGEDVAVSTSYIPTERAEDPGEYDGQSYQHVLESIQPDHIGVLPNGQGRDPSARTLVANSVRSITSTLGAVLGGGSDVRVNLRADQYVQWDFSGGDAYGKITEIVSDGSRSVDGNTRTVEAGDGEQIAVIDHLSEDGEPQNQRVLKLIREDGDNENSLRAWDAPAQARANQQDTAMPDDITPEDLTLGEHVVPFLAGVMGLPDDDVAAFADAMNPDTESNVDAITAAMEASDAVDTDAVVDALSDGPAVNEGEPTDDGGESSGDGDGAGEGEPAANQAEGQTDFSARVAANKAASDDGQRATFGSYSTRREDN